MQNFVTFHVILRKKLIVGYFINKKLLCEWLKANAKRLLHSSLYFKIIMDSFVLLRRELTLKTTVIYYGSRKAFSFIHIVSETMAHRGNPVEISKHEGPICVDLSEQFNENPRPSLKIL